MRINLFDYIKKCDFEMLKKIKEIVDERIEVLEWCKFLKEKELK